MASDRHQNLQCHSATLHFGGKCCTLCLCVCLSVCCIISRKFSNEILDNLRFLQTVTVTMVILFVKVSLCTFSMCADILCYNKLQEINKYSKLNTWISRFIFSTLNKHFMINLKKNQKIFKGIFELNTREFFLNIIFFNFFFHFILRNNYPTNELTGPTAVMNTLHPHVPSMHCGERVRERE